MPDLKDINADSLISSIQKYADSLKRDLTHSMNRAIEDVLLAARVLKELPEMTDTLFQNASSVIVEEVEGPMHRIQSLSIEYETNNGCQHLRLAGNQGAKSKMPSTQSGRVRLLLFVIPIGK